MIHNACPADPVLAWSEHLGDETRRPELEAHLAACAHCTEMVRRIVRDEAIVRQLREGQRMDAAARARITSICRGILDEVKRTRGA